MEQKQIVEDLLSMRSNIYDLMADAKLNRANGKFFAYKKCYNMMAGVIHGINSQLPEKERKQL